MSTNTFELVRDAVKRIQNSQRNVRENETFLLFYLFIFVYRYCTKFNVERFRIYQKNLRFETNKNF